MKRLAMTAAIGVIAFAVPGVAPSSGASRSPSSAAASTASSSFASSAAPTLDLATLRQVEGPPTAAPSGSAANRASAAGRSSRSASDASVWAALAECESNGNPRAVGGGGRYFGAFQFSLATWHSLGFDGSPLDASFALQRLAAQRLQARSGWDQWPRCSRHLGLR